MTIMALERIEGEPTRAALLKAMQQGEYDLDGIKLVFGANDNQGSDRVFLTIIDREGRFRAATALK